jgi:hypothetical protein
MQINVNGRIVTANKPRYSYEEIVAIAGKAGNPTTVYYWQGPGDITRQGTLYTGKSINVEDGMQFTCVHTGNA